MERFAPQSKLALSPRLIDYLQDKIVMPINVEISLCGFCNASCSFCFYNSEYQNTLPGWDKNYLKYDTIFKLYTEFFHNGIKAITYTGGGDSSLHPKIKEITELAHSLNIKQGFITNGIRVKYDPKLFEWVRVSLTDKPWPIENLKKLRECKVLGMNINYTGNEEEVKKSLEIAYQVNADYLEVRPALNLNGLVTNCEPPKIEDPKLKKINYKFEDSKEKHTYKKCQGYHFVPFIWQNGEVNVCAYHFGKKDYVLGNIYNESFTSIMSKAPKFVPVIPECQICCKNDQINKLINNLQDVTDVEFV